MSALEPTVHCPVINSQINGDNCYVMCEIADGMINPSVLHDEPAILPPGTEWTEKLRQMCLNCPYHADVD